MLNRRALLQAGGGAVAAAAIGGVGAETAFGIGRGWERLRSRLTGDLVLPSDPGYAQAKQLQIAQYDSVNPQAIAYCANTTDVRDCVRFAQAHGIPVRVRSGGHNLSGWSTIDGLVIDLARINHVAVGGSTLTLGAGLQSVDALAKLRPHNKQIPAGTCPTVAQGGFLSGGGIGYQTRKFGLGSDRIVSAGVVLASGRFVRASTTEEPDLYWALRGGGGNNFGVVVDFEVRPINAPTSVNFDLMWSIDDALDVFAAWQAWISGGSNDIGTSLVVLPPADAGGAAVVLVTGSCLGPRPALETALNQLVERAGVQPLSRVVGGQLPYADSLHIKYCREMTLEQCHREGTTPAAELPRMPFQRQSYQFVNRTLTAAETGSLFSTWDSHTTLKHRYIQCIAMGGAMSDTGRTATAFVNRDAKFLLGYQVGLDSPTPPREEIAEATAWTDAGAAALEPLASGSYINFPSSRPVADWATSTYGENHARLRRVKRRYDPAGFFRHPQSIRP
ncbi:MULTISPECIES: FAD-binding protein [unclassified Streptomyces]|uniref:FAD-binding oxidoreductase n=1 Tax=unclassified Streptomyces TaxID=2593676 RepID=UPI0033CE3744